METIPAGDTLLQPACKECNHVPTLVSSSPLGSLIDAAISWPLSPVAALLLLPAAKAKHCSRSNTNDMETIFFSAAKIGDLRERWY